MSDYLPTAADTAAATIAAFADAHAGKQGIPLAKAYVQYLESEEGRNLYCDYSIAKSTPETNGERAKYNHALAALAKAYENDGDTKWQAMTKALATPLGRELYRLAAEAA